jgi:hypothetical protein
VNTGFCRRYSWLVIALSAALVVSARPLLAQPSSDDSGAPAAGGELKNVAVVAGAKWEKLIEDVTYLGSLGGKPEAGQMLEGGFSFFTQGKGPNAIDKTKPWGVIVQTDGAQFLPVGCLPVLKPNDLIQVAKGYGAEVKEPEDGVQELVLPNKRSIFVKQDNGMAFISISAASLARVPANAQDILAKLVGEYDIAAHISVRNVPEMYRNFALQAMQAGVQQGLKKKDDESDEQYAERQKMAEAQMAQMTQMINEVDNVKVGWAVDSKQQRMFADFTYAFVPGSKLAKQMSAYGEPKTNFAGFYQTDAAATITVATQADPKLIAEDMSQLDATISSTKDQLNAEIDKKVDDEDTREALKGAFSDWFDAIAETLKSGHLDGAAALHAGADSLTFISGFHIKDTAKVESGFKKLETAGKKQPDFPGIKWNALTHAGVAFHTITIPVPETEKSPRKMLGDKLDIAVGIGPETAYLAFGKDNIAAVKKAIDDSAANKGKSVPPFDFSLSLTPIIEVAAAQADDPKAQAISEKVLEFLKKEGQGRDHIRVVGQMVPNGLKYHFEAEEGVLKAIGQAAAAAQQQKMQAQQ